MKYAPNKNLYLLEIILANVEMKGLALTVSHFMHTHRIKEPECGILDVYESWEPEYNAQESHESWPEVFEAISARAKEILIDKCPSNKEWFADFLDRLADGDKRLFIDDTGFHDELHEFIESLGLKPDNSDFAHVGLMSRRKEEDRAIKNLRLYGWGQKPNLSIGHVKKCIDLMIEKDRQVL